MNPFLFISALVATHMCFVQGQSSQCTSPSGATGSCISLYDCAPLMSIINNPNKSQKDVDLLRKSQCGFEGKTPKVCCVEEQSNSCFTPDAKQGQCVSVYSCPHIANMLKPPVLTESVNFVQQSRCSGSDRYSVCCGPPPDLNPRPNPGPGGVCTQTPTAAPPDPRSRCCGVDNSAEDKIVGGNETAIDQYPWLVIIEYVKQQKIKLLCGGALISGRYVLTAGHCVAGPVLDVGIPRNVRLGEYDISNDAKDKDCVEVSGGGPDCTEGVTVIGIEKIIPHPDYNPNHSLRRNDIALLRLRQNAPYTDFIRPICLPSVNYTKQTPEKFSLTASGWGAVNSTHSKSNIKLHVELPFVTKDVCQPPYNHPRRNVALWKGQLCAGGVQDKDSCKGDSGGPLMYRNDAKLYEIVGVVSFGPTPCGMENIPGVYTNVYEYISWIRSQIQP